MDSSLGDRLTKLRHMRKMTQSELGKYIGKSKASINAYEHDISLPPIDVIMKLARLYKVTSDYLLCDSDRKYVILDGLTVEQEDLLSKIDLLLIELFKSKHGGSLK